MAATESAAMTVVLRCQGRDRVSSVSSTNSGPSASMSWAV